MTFDQANCHLLFLLRKIVNLLYRSYMLWINEHFKPNFNAVSASAIVFQQPVKQCIAPHHQAMTGYVPF